MITSQIFYPKLRNQIVKLSSNYWITRAEEKNALNIGGTMQKSDLILEYQNERCVGTMHKISSQIFIQKY